MNRTPHFQWHYLLSIALSLFAIQAQAQFECDPDTTEPVAICDDMISVSVHPTEGRVIYPNLIDEGSFDFCNPIPAENYRIEFNEDFTGTPATTTQLYLPPTFDDYTVTLWVGDQVGNWNSCWSNLTVNGYANMVRGQVYTDANYNCENDMGDTNTNLAGMPIRVWVMDTGENYYTFTQADGSYSVMLDDVPIGALYQIRIFFTPPAGLGSGCNNTFLTSTNAEGLIEHDFAFNINDDCYFTTVDVSTPFLRRCFDNTYYVTYCNYSVDEITNATIEVELDDFLSLTGATLPYSSLGNNTFVFTIDSIPPAECHSFQMTIYANCELEFGQSQCVQATISPFDCFPEAPAWSGASIAVDGECDETNDIVRFTVQNQGDNAISIPLNYQVVEDVVMYMQDQIEDLPGGQQQQFEYPANGATWHFSVDQEPDHPGQESPIAFVEGCGGLTPGIVNQFGLNDADPYYSIDCQEVIGSFDPNDKQAFPRGFGEVNYIEQNIPIEYKIRFQNTGTDTAFNVVVQDELSPYLNPASLRPGSSSHPYRLEVQGDNLLRFHFDNIMLPDSNVNEPASHGFVKFWIEQQPDNPLGTVIENNAGIYFDFNEPVITNTVTHTVGTDFVIVSTVETQLPEAASLEVLPNPIAQEATFRLKGYTLDKGQFQLMDVNGKPIFIEAFSGSEYQFVRRQLVAGVYFYRIVQDGNILASGKVVLR